MEDYKKAIAKNVKKLRIKAGKSQHELAKATGIAQPSINKMEKEGRPMSLKSLYRLSKAFGCDITDILPAKSKDLTGGVEVF